MLLLLCFVVDIVVLLMLLLAYITTKMVLHFKTRLGLLKSKELGDDSERRGMLGDIVPSCRVLIVTARLP